MPAPFRFRVSQTTQFEIGRHILLSIGLVFGTFSTLEASDPTEKFFEEKIRPLLSDRCISCHSGEKPDGGLSLDSREGWSSRQVIILGDPRNSPLIRAVKFEDADLQMPPADSGISRLSQDQISDLEKWILDGAFDPRLATNASLGPKRRPREFKITQQDLQHWAYQPLQVAQLEQSQSIPDDNSTEPSSIRSAAMMIDRLIDDELKEQDLHRSSAATARELVRRAYFDLWGLPPEPEAVASFERDPSDKAWQALVDHLLASPHYGQRWGRYWLDWVRYAETNGYERDGLKPNAWRFRDFVIRSFNQDKPYDRFLIEQLAGDQLIEEEGLTFDEHPELWKDAVIATGYYRLHVWDDEPDSTEAAELDDLDDVMVTTGAAVMGMTLGCARCHDHKFDPLSQVDYYGMLDLLRDIDPYGQSKKGGGGRGTGSIETFLCSPKDLADWQTAKSEQIRTLDAKLASAAEAEKAEITQQLKRLKESTPPFEKALSVNAPAGGRKPTFVLARGDHHTPGQQVESGIPGLFTSLQNENGSAEPNLAIIAAGSSSNSAQIDSRLKLARWLTDSEHPLTARVLVNRIWQNHFGVGIVPTPDDFGFTGIAPSNIRLLDFLASQLIKNDWSIKSLHRTIMLSEAYRMSSACQNRETAIAQKIDPDNRWFWRQNLRRLDAEAIRDSMIAYAGSLHTKSDGPSVYSTLSPEVRDTANPVSLSTWGASADDEQNCRSVFLVVKRSLKDPLLESFDFANSHSPVGQRPVTTVAPQALMLLNDRFVKRQAELLATRVLNRASDPDMRLQQLWQIVFQRTPTTKEVESSIEFVKRQTESGRPEIDAWTSLARAVLNSNECIYID